ncbi:probable E3 ubiquitin-protein ligase ATL44 [Miscanthus floridulus]|uniref:probable E3 ubiquitin-protein ligase ATL44 n=1 Tax=Miscanthus floridulus TaxID=154761 RepID=UPI003458079E
MRHLQATVVEHLAGVAAAATATPPPASVHTDTFLILAAVLCFLLCVVGLAFVARCSRLCNPSSYSVDADDDEAAAMPADMGAPRPRKGIEKGALEKLPTVPFEADDEAAKDGDERPECAICLAEFARGDEVRVLPPCGHAFHAPCVDTWLLCTSTCPSCRTALVVAQQQAPPPAAASADPPLQCCASAQASAGPAEYPVTLAVVVVERGPCRTSGP